MGAVCWEVDIVSATVIKVHLGASDPTAVRKQTEPEVRSAGVAVAALDETLFSLHHRLDESEIAMVGQMRTISHDQRHLSRSEVPRFAITGNPRVDQETSRGRRCFGAAYLFLIHVVGNSRSRRLRVARGDMYQRHSRRSCYHAVASAADDDDHSKCRCPLT